MIRYDGHIYEKESDVPDLGSLECVDVIGNKRNYVGLYADVDKLPKYDDLASDSTATLYTEDGIKEIYTYLASKKAWYKN